MMQEQNDFVRGRVSGKNSIVLQLCKPRIIKLELIDLGKLFFFCPMALCPTRATASSVFRFLDHTQ